MQIIELAIDEDLLARIDRIAHELSLSRVVFIQQAVEAALHQQNTLAKERQHALGYERSPVVPSEFDDWKACKFGSNLEELWEKLQKQETQSSTKWTVF